MRRKRGIEHAMLAPINLSDIIKELAPLVTALGVLLTVIMSWRASNRALLAAAKIEEVRLKTEENHRATTEATAKIEAVREKTEEIKKQTDGITSALVKVTAEKERLLGKAEGKAEEKAAVAKKAEIIADFKNGIPPKSDDQT